MLAGGVLESPVRLRLTSVSRRCESLPVIDRRNIRALNPFLRLGALLADVPPGRSPAPGGAPLLLSVGEPRSAPPDFVAEVIAGSAAGWGCYPPARGAGDYERAAAAWAVRRYGLGEGAAAAGGVLDPAVALVPVPGSREGLFFATLATVPMAGGAATPLVLVPSPGYHVYASAAVAAGAEPLLVPATAENGFVPDYAGLGADILERTALAFLCSPSNPQGAVAGLEQLCELLALARRHRFVLVLDECYAEIYTGAPPPGGLQAAQALGGDTEGLLVFHSLSKRSSAPGLRCGFAAGDPRLIDALDGMLRAGGAGVAQPVLAAGARLWRDEAHVAPNRARYRENFAIAERVLGRRFAWRQPAGGFFMWLDVGDGEAAARALWAEAGIRVMPGGYMSRDDLPGGNPGARYVRIALVDGPELTEAALVRLTAIL
jgi:aspartate/methionine/tyrosine aminotransferase